MTSPVVGKVTLEAGIDTGDLKRQLQSQLTQDLQKQVIPQIEKLNDELHDSNAEIAKMQKASLKDLAKQMRFVADEHGKIVKSKQNEVKAERALTEAKKAHEDKTRKLLNTEKRYNQQIKENGKATATTENSYKNLQAAAAKAYRTIGDKERELRQVRAETVRLQAADDRRRDTLSEAFRRKQIAGFQKVVKANAGAISTMIAQGTRQTDAVARQHAAQTASHSRMLAAQGKAQDAANAKAERKMERSLRRQQRDLRAKAMSPITGAGELGRAAFNLSPKASTGALAATLGGAGLVAGGAASLAKTLIVLPSMATAAAAGIGTLVAATQGMGNTFKALSSGDMRKFAQEFDKLSPQAQDLTRQYQGLLPKLGDIRKKMQDALFLNTDDMLFGLSNAYIPVIDKLGTRISGSFNKMMQAATDELMKPGTQKQIGTITDNIGAAFEHLIPIIQPLIQAFTDLTEVGSSFLPGLADTLVDATKDFANFIRTAKESGNLAKWFEQGKDMLGTVIDIVKSLGKFLLALAPIAENILPKIAAVLESIVNLLGEHPTALYNVLGLFLAASVGKGIWNIVKGLREMKVLTLEIQAMSGGTSILGGFGGRAGKAGLVPGAVGAAGKGGKVGGLLKRGVAGIGLKGGAGMLGGTVALAGATGGASGLVGQDEDAIAGRVVDHLATVGGLTATGAVIGSVVPGVGTAIGAGVGAAVGGGIVAWKEIARAKKDDSAATEEATGKTKEYAEAAALAAESQADMNGALIASGGAWDASAIAGSKETLANQVDALRTQSSGAAKILTDKFGSNLRGLEPIIRAGGPGYEALLKNIERIGGPDADKALEFLRNFRTELGNAAASSVAAKGAFDKLLGPDATQDAITDKIIELKQVIDALPDNKSVSIKTPEGQAVYDTVKSISDEIETLPTGELHFKVPPNPEVEAFLRTVKGLVIGPNNIILSTYLDQATFDAAQLKLAGIFNLNVTQDRTFVPGAPATPGVGVPGLTGGMSTLFGGGGFQRLPQTAVPPPKTQAEIDADNAKAQQHGEWDAKTPSEIADILEERITAAGSGTDPKDAFAGMAGQPGNPAMQVDVTNFPAGITDISSALGGTGGASPWDLILPAEGGTWDNNNTGGWSTSSGAPRGGLQITDGTWKDWGGEEFAPTANLASREDQIKVAERIAWGWNGKPGRGLEPWEAVTKGNVPGVTANMTREQFYAKTPGGGTGRQTLGGGMLRFGGTYSVPDKDIAQGGPGFPDWVYAMEREFNVHPSTYAGHQTDRGQGNQGIDWYGSQEDMKRFALFMQSIKEPGTVEDVIFQDAQGNKIGANQGRIVGPVPGTADAGYFRDDWKDHLNHVHTTMLKNIESMPQGAATDPNAAYGKRMTDPYGRVGEYVVDTAEVKRLNQAVIDQFADIEPARIEMEKQRQLSQIIDPNTKLAMATAKDVADATLKHTEAIQDWRDAQTALAEAQKGTFQENTDATNALTDATKDLTKYYDELPFGNLEKMIHAGILGGGGTEQNVGALMDPILTALGQPAGGMVTDVMNNIVKAVTGAPGAMTPGGTAKLMDLVAEGSPLAPAAAAGIDVPSYARQGGGPGATDLMSGESIRDAMGRVYTDTAALIDRTATNLRVQDEARHEQVMAALRAIAQRVGADLLTPTVAAGVTAGINAVGGNTANQIGVGLGESAAPIIASAISQIQQGQTPKFTDDQIASIRTGLGNAGIPLFDEGGLWDSGTAGMNLSGSTERVLSPSQTSLFDAGLLGGWNAQPLQQQLAGSAAGSTGEKNANATVGAAFFGVSGIPILGPIVNVLVGVLLDILGVEIQARDTMLELTDEFRDFRGDQFKSFDAAGRMMNDTSSLLDRSSTDEETATQERIRIFTTVLKGLVDYVMKLAVNVLSAAANAALGVFNSILGPVIDASNEYGFLVSPIVTAITGALGGGIIEMVAGIATSIVSAITSLLFGGLGVFDEGGVAVGKGMMPKATIAPERVLSPSETASFDRLVDSLERGEVATSRNVVIHAPFTVQGGEAAGRAAHARLLTLMS